MRLASPAVAAGLVYLAGVALAQPPPDSPDDACCCCDIRSMVISCTLSIPKNDCVCAAVACPPNAKTVWDHHKHKHSPTASKEAEITGLTPNMPFHQGGATLPVVGARPTEPVAVNVQDEPFHNNKPIYPAGSSELPKEILPKVKDAEKTSGM
ncbi:hypothetical protein E4U43_005798 [Claviceps pusilla]|uniref:Extracellular membrane protein CFEM domain-containing protein n=1 Tax=Claviceps pusilla TaxID=123648 RepID=A0A9P7NE72_9HYPO|nr:hypothetical protein E4U43_005798 [Claviceps pusilla]